MDSAMMGLYSHVDGAPIMAHIGPGANGCMGVDVRL